MDKRELIDTLEGEKGIVAVDPFKMFSADEIKGALKAFNVAIELIQQLPDNECEMILDLEDFLVKCSVCGYAPEMLERESDKHCAGCGAKIKCWKS